MAHPWLKRPLGLLPAGLALACQDPTQVTVRISTNVPCARVNGVSLTVGAHGTLEDKPPSDSWTTCDPATETIGTVAVVPRGGDDEELGMKLVLAVTKGRAEDCRADDDPPYDGCVVARRTMRLLRHQTLYVSVPLDVDCRRTPCDRDSTCYRAGICRD
ncbi:MAG TPA: hypothetical protein VFS00_01765, partial [Polyangiaceae bacterium]|nr:hypothetical protein [Polyangiaceae bacterium]